MTALDAGPDLKASLWRVICLGQDEAALAALDRYLAVRESCSANLSLEDFSRPGVGAGKSAHRLARRMLREIVERPEHWNRTLGSEAAMGAHFNANADIIRQAVRLIEDLERGAWPLRRSPP